MIKEISLSPVIVPSSKGGHKLIYFCARIVVQSIGWSGSESEILILVIKDISVLLLYNNWAISIGARLILINLPIIAFYRWYLDHLSPF